MDAPIQDEPTVPFEELITKSDLKNSYFLSEGWVKRLGPPDVVKPNPYYSRRAAPMQLFKRERIIQFLDQHHEEYSAWLLKREKLSLRRRAQQELKQELKRQSTLDWAQGVEIIVRPLPSNLMEKAVAHFTIRAKRRREPGFNPGRVNLKGVLAYLRHNFTNYEELCDEGDGRVGSLEAYFIINNRVESLLLDAILKDYGPGFFYERVQDLEYQYPDVRGQFMAILSGEQELPAPPAPVPPTWYWQLKQLLEVFQKLGIPPSN